MSRLVCSPVSLGVCLEVTVPSVRRLASTQPDQHCATTPETECSTVPSLACTPVIKRHCVSVPSRSCSKVQVAGPSKLSCRTVMVQMELPSVVSKCEERKEKVCIPVHKTKCEKEPKDVCGKVDIEVCKDKPTVSTKHNVFIIYLHIDFF